MPGDVNLSNFSLTREDLFFKVYSLILLFSRFDLPILFHIYWAPQIPYIAWAQALSSKPIKLLASPWSAPAWMKSNNKLYGKGYLLPEYYQVWAEYFVRYNITFYFHVLYNYIKQNILFLKSDF